MDVELQLLELMKRITAALEAIAAAVVDDGMAPPRRPDPHDE